MRTRPHTFLPPVLALTLLALLATPLLALAQGPAISMSSQDVRSGSTVEIIGTSSIREFSAEPEAVAAEAEAANGAETAPLAPPSGNTSGDIAVLLIIAVVLGGVAFGGIVVLRQQRDVSPPGMGKGDDFIWGGGAAEAPPETATDEPHWKKAQTTTQSAQTEG